MSSKEIIIVPTDFSKAAQNAANYACELAKVLDAKIFLLNAVIPPQTSAGVIKDFSESLRATGEEGLKKELMRLQDRFQELEFETKCVVGGLARTIEGLHRGQPFKVVIMGTTGASGFKELFIGSNTASVIQNLDIPVIAIPESYTNYRWEEIVLASDLNPIEEQKLFDILIDINKSANSKIHLINVLPEKAKNDPVEFVNDAINLDEIFLGQRHTFKFLESENIEKEITNYADGIDANLIAVVSRKRNFFQNLFHKSISKKLCLHSNRPLLVITEI